MKRFARIALIVSGAIFFIWFAFPVLVGVLNSGNVCGIMCSLALILYGIFMTGIHRLIAKLWKNYLGRSALLVLSALVLVTASFVLFTAVKIVDAAYNKPEEETTVVVLGCRVYESGPSNLLRSRLDAAYEFLMENPDSCCVLSGGQGSDEPTSEAFAMYEYLVAKGIAPERLYMEDKSTSTRENLAFSKQIIENEGLCPTVTIVTNDFHQYRAARVASDLSIKSYSVSGGTPLYLLPTYFVREIGGALYEYVVK